MPSSNVLSELADLALITLSVTKSLPGDVVIQTLMIDGSLILCHWAAVSGRTTPW